jgi:hypothetical protein
MAVTQWDETLKEPVVSRYSCALGSRKARHVPRWSSATV